MSENTSEAGRRDPPRTCFESLSGQPYLPVGPEAYVEKALRELALQVLPPTTRGGQGPAAALALGADAFAELRQRFFDLAENAADFMPVRDKVAPHVQRARSEGVTHVDVRCIGRTYSGDG
ncbi:MAG: hypothetical protein WCG47_23440 [Dermatophilaceae bacterium]